MISSLQILSFNFLSVTVILFGNLFSARNNKSECFMPLGYIAFFAGIINNAVVLGTWSFYIITDAIPLIDRLVGTFDILHSMSKKLLYLKLLHTIIWGFYVLVFLYLLYASIYNQINLYFWIAIGLEVIEVTILIIFKGKCPLTILGYKDVT